MEPVLVAVYGTAIEAELARAPRQDFDRLLVLGDIVGYGADPNGVVDRIRELRPDLIIRGMEKAIAAKTVTYDLARQMPGSTEVSTSKFADAVITGMRG